MNKIEEKYGLKTGHAIALFAILILNIAWIICDFILFKGNMLFQVWVSIFMFVGAAIYACYGYKKPHGNHMRYLCLFQAICVAYLLFANAKYQPEYVNANYLIIILLTTYMAGRLEHYKQNYIICFILLVCHCVSVYYLIDMLKSVNLLTIVNVVACLGPVGVWLAIAGAYLTRYKLHKEAGFEDKK